MLLRFPLKPLFIYLSFVIAINIEVLSSRAILILLILVSSLFLFVECGKVRFATLSAVKTDCDLYSHVQPLPRTDSM